jgi:hypothetical protein
MSGGSTFWKWTTKERKLWKEDYKEAGIVCGIFALTGSASLLVVRPALKYTIGLEGSWRDGPNSYRITSLILVSPVYACMLFAIGTLSGRHIFFAQMSQKILSRFFPLSLIERVTVCSSGKKLLSARKVSK